MENAEKYVPEMNFVTFILTLSSSAWVSLGKISDPLSGEVKKDLEGAKYTIDALIMLREKTKGNLNEEEQKVLNDIISELQANYAETFFVDEARTPGDESPQDETTGSEEKGTSNKETNNQEK
jgi:hypothetical protein